MQMLVDDEDYDFLSQFKCSVFEARKGSFYAIKTKPINGTRYIHRILINAKPGYEVDHINGNGLDNRRCNLRIATPSQNRMNRGKQRNNTSGYKGVYWNKDCKKWLASITIVNKQKHLGLFTEIKDAARAYNKAAIDYFGEYAIINSDV